MLDRGTDVSLLGGSGVADGVMTANVRCMSALSLSRSLISPPGLSLYLPTCLPIYLPSPVIPPPG